MASPLPLSVGVTPWREDPVDGPDAKFAAQVATAESLGFDSFFLAESHFIPGAQPAPLILLAQAAGCTERIRLGTSSLLLPVRNPLLLAEQIATLDRVSQGRLILGLGRGFRKQLFEVFGIDPSLKRDLLEDSLAQMQAAWAGKPLREGSKARLFPRPLQLPHPPLWMAAFGPKALEQAARLEMPYLASPLESETQLAENYRQLAAASQEHGAALGSTRPVMRTVFIHDDGAVRARVLRALASEHDDWKPRAPRLLRQALDTPVEERVIVGTAPEVEDRIQRLSERLSVSHLIARCRVPDASAAEVEAAVENLAALAQTT